MTDEAEISKKYRELGTEEPPRALDEAILAAARREAGAGRRWYAPLATAAVLVLAVAVTLNMQFERPGIESPVAQRTDPPAPEASSVDAKEELKLKATADLKLAPRPAAAPTPAPPPAREPQPFAASQAPERVPGAAGAASAAARADDARDSRGPASSVTGEAARQMEGRTSRDAEAAERAPRMGAIQALAKRAEPQEKPQAAKTGDTPERELERIAELRGQGRHEEADKALAEFRKRYPEFRIPDATRERVERR